MIDVFYLGPPPGLQFLARPLMLFAIAVAAALFWHRRQPRFWRASLEAMLTSAVIFYVVALSGWVYSEPFVMRFAYFDVAIALRTQMLIAFWLMVLVSTLLGSFVIAVLVGWLRRRQRDGVIGVTPGSDAP